MTVLHRYCFTSHSNVRSKTERATRPPIEEEISCQSGSRGVRESLCMPLVDVSVENVCNFHVAQFRFAVGEETSRRPGSEVHGTGEVCAILEAWFLSRSTPRSAAMLRQYFLHVRMNRSDRECVVFSTAPALEARQSCRNARRTAPAQVASKGMEGRLQRVPDPCHRDQVC